MAVTDNGKDSEGPVLLTDFYRTPVMVFLCSNTENKCAEQRPPQGSKMEGLGVQRSFTRLQALLAISETSEKCFSENY